MRLIDADALIKSTDKESIHIYEIALAPTVDPVKHGHWVKSLDHYDRYMCSVCGHLTDKESDNYCSYCGAKMDEVQDEAN